MRRRLILTSVAVAVVAVLLLGVPLAIAGFLTRSDDVQKQVVATAGLIGTAVQARADHREPITQDVLREIPFEDGYVEVRLPGGRSIDRGAQPAGPYFAGVYQGADGTTVKVFEPRDGLRDDALRTGLIILGVGIVAVLAAVGVGLLQVRRLSTPLVHLAERAEQLGSGDTSSTLPPSGIEEVDRVADMLAHSASRVERLIASERQFASDASHQLRTPLTALSMRLEEILAADDPRTVREEARSALAQVERLATVVEHLLDNVRDNNLRAGPVALDDVVIQQVVEWEPAFSAVGRRIVATGTRGLVAMATPNGLSQVIATLLENSLAHGAGTVTVSTRSTGISLVVEVTDEGPGVPAELGARIFERSVSGRRSTGLGLAVARELAEADGGRLELVQQKPPVFALFLSAAETGPR
ncbi:MAG TPA: HAMP domain-containing sensor histidine kinase [Actinomycetes bacterium]